MKKYGYWSKIMGMGWNTSLVLGVALVLLGLDLKSAFESPFLGSAYISTLRIKSSNCCFLLSSVWFLQMRSCTFCSRSFYNLSAFDTLTSYYWWSCSSLSYDFAMSYHSRSFSSNSISLFRKSYFMNFILRFMVSMTSLYSSSYLFFSFLFMASKSYIRFSFILFKFSRFSLLLYSLLYSSSYSCIRS